MGYEAPIEVVDATSGHWIGAARPDVPELDELFRRVVRLDVGALDTGQVAARQAWQEILPPGIRFIRLLGPRSVHLQATRAPEIPELVLKLLLPRSESGWRWLIGRVDRSRAHRAHMWAHRLRALGVDTPRPLGFVERARNAARGPSWVAFEYVEAMTLIELKDQDLPPLGVGKSALQEKRALIARVAALLRTLHRHGLVHDELSARRVLVAPECVMPIGLDALRRPVTTGHAFVDNLAALERDFADARQISRSDRMRFLDGYVQHLGDRPARRRELWAKVLKASGRPMLPTRQAFPSPP